MNPSAPWSVKGIDPDVRSLAKRAAQRQACTLGAWLSEVIRTAAVDEAAGSASPGDPASAQSYQEVSVLGHSLHVVAQDVIESNQHLREHVSAMAKALLALANRIEAMEGRLEARHDEAVRARLDLLDAG